jgi:hypothetical protein
LEEIKRRADAAAEELSCLNVVARERQRRDFLLAQTKAVSSLSSILSGDTLDFDKESEALYGIRSPGLPLGRMDDIKQELDRLLPGEGSLQKRHREYMEGFRVKPEKLVSIIKDLSGGIRNEVEERLPLPPDSLRMNLVAGVPWEAYNWYLGGAHSRIDVNSDIPIDANRVILYVCHEAYPGHHSMWALRERFLLRERGWIEHCLVALRSPLALVAEGAAQYGVEMVFPSKRRATYYEISLFPSLGLPPREAELYEKISRLGTDLMFRRWVDVTRDMLDNNLGEQETLSRMQEELLLAPEAARAYLGMMRSLRSYVISYSAGFDLVQNYVESQEDRWSAFREVLMEPRTVDHLREY